MSANDCNSGIEDPHREFYELGVHFSSSLHWPIGVFKLIDSPFVVKQSNQACMIITKLRSKSPFQESDYDKTNSRLLECVFVVGCLKRFDTKDRPPLCSQEVYHTSREMDLNKQSILKSSEAQLRVSEQN